MKAISIDKMALFEQKLIFNRTELAGSLADLGTMIPLAVGMVAINGLNAAGIFFTSGIYYILSGFYFKITVPVQPMKLISAYAIAVGYDIGAIRLSTLIIGALLLVIGFTGIAGFIAKALPKSVIRGIQVSVGMLLAIEGVKFVIGTTPFQTLLDEPFLRVQSIGPLPVGIVMGVIAFLMILFLLNNKKVPAALAVISVGLIIGLIFGKHGDWEGISIFSLPQVMPFQLPSLDLLTTAMLSLVLPQLPLSISNSVISAPNVAKEYYGEYAKAVTPKAVSISMGIANIFTSFFGGMPLCHGSGGYAAHYRFGSRSAGSNIIIGAIFVFIAIFFGAETMSVINLLPLSVLGVLLAFSGVELSLMIKDLKAVSELTVVFFMIAVTFASNLAFALAAGIFLHYFFKRFGAKI